MNRSSPIKVLLVEDDAIHARLMRRALETQRLRCRIVHRPDGESALREMRGSDEPALAGVGEAPGLVLLDLRLPGIDGYEVLRAIRADASIGTIPVVVVSTSDDPDDVLRAYRLGANAFVTKSPDFLLFAARLQCLSRFWLEAARLPSAVGAGTSEWARDE